jgi:hypothetical protein
MHRLLSALIYNVWYVPIQGGKAGGGGGGVPPNRKPERESVEIINNDF